MADNKDASCDISQNALGWTIYGLSMQISLKFHSLENNPNWGMKPISSIGPRFLCHLIVYNALIYFTQKKVSDSMFLCVWNLTDIKLLLKPLWVWESWNDPCFMRWTVSFQLPTYSLQPAFPTFGPPEGASPPFLMSQLFKLQTLKHCLVETRRENSPVAIKTNNNSFIAIKNYRFPSLPSILNFWSPHCHYYYMNDNCSPHCHWITLFVPFITIIQMVTILQMGHRYRD